MQKNENINSYQNSFIPMTSNSNNFFFNKYIIILDFFHKSKKQKYYQNSKELKKENMNLKNSLRNKTFKKLEIMKETNENTYIINNNNSYIKSNEKIKFIKNIIINKEKLSINNPQEVNEYFNDIHNYLLEEENNYYINSDYMYYQIEINEKMRAILIDWLIQVHFIFKLKPETLYLTVNIIDKYLEKKQVKRTNLQLVGITAMLIASKYEEMYPPEIKNFIFMTNNEYTKKEMIEMESEILITLNYDLTFPTLFKYLEIYKIKLNLNEHTFLYSWYCIELCLNNYKMIKYKNSIISASACFIALNLFKINNDNLLENVTGYKIIDMDNCIKDIYLLFENNEYNLTSIKKNFH